MVGSRRIVEYKIGNSHLRVPVGDMGKWENTSLSKDTWPEELQGCLSIYMRTS